MSVLTVIYWCPVCRLYHVDTFIEFINAEPFHRASDGSLHAVTKAKSSWLN